MPDAINLGSDAAVPTKNPLALKFCRFVLANNHHFEEVSLLLFEKSKNS